MGLPSWKESIKAILIFLLKEVNNDSTAKFIPAIKNKHKLCH
jgi:hypothetical protein